MFPVVSIPAPLQKPIWEALCVQAAEGKASTEEAPAQLLPCCQSMLCQGWTCVIRVAPEIMLKTKMGFAVYQTLSASPSMISTANAVIACSQLEEKKTSSADALKAYVQLDLRSLRDTYVRLPREVWPDGWGDRYQRPLVRLRKSLHGHPESGAHWQKHLEQAVGKLNGIPVSGHPSIFLFADRDLVMTVYVDDLLLSGASHEHSRF